MRSLTTSASAALSAPVITTAVLVEMMFSTPVRLNNTPFTINHAGADWLGAGALGSVEPLREAAGGEVVGVEFTLSGVPTENLALALAESPRGKACRVYLAVLDSVSGAVLDAPLIFPGVLDTMAIREEGQQGVIAVTAMHLGKHLQRVKSIRYSDADQRRLYPGDSSMRFVVSQSQHQDVWPAASFFRK